MGADAEESLNHINLTQTKSKSLSDAYWDQLKVKSFVDISVWGAVATYSKSGANYHQNKMSRVMP